MSKPFHFSGLRGAVLLALGSASGGAALAHRISSTAWAHREQEYQRQLQGALTEREKQIEALHTELGLARSQLVPQDALEQQYQVQLTQKDAAFEKFRQAHDLRVQGLSSSLFRLRQEVQAGTTKVQEVPSSPRVGGDTASLERPAISYEYADTEGRVHLTDPDIWVPGNEHLKLTQRFQVRGTVLRQADGSLMTQRVQLIELSPADRGTPRELARAELEDASFTYANAPQEGPSPSSGQGPSWMVTVGATPWTGRSLRFGPSLRVARLGGLGLATGLSSDFKSWTGSGADVLVTYTPTLRGRDLGLALGGGIHLPVGGTTRVLPNLTLSFIVY